MSNEYVVTKVREAVEELLVTKLSELDVKAIVEEHMDRTAEDVREVANSILGIETRWRTKELEDGYLRDEIKETVTDMVESHLRPKLEKAVAHQLKLKSTDLLIARAIKSRVKEAVDRSVNGYRSSVSTLVEDRVLTIAEEILEEGASK